MITDEQMLSQIDAAEQFIDKKYMDDLNEYEVREIPAHEKKFNLTRLYAVSKIVYDKDEDINEKLISVFHSVMPFCTNLVLILKGTEDGVQLYIGTRATQISNASTSGEILHDSFQGNFPGSGIQWVKTSDIPDVFKLGSAEKNISSQEKHIAYMNILPSERMQKESYSQGLEKFIDTMRGQNYICEILATPLSAADIEMRLSGFEELYTALYPFSKKTSSHGHNEGRTLTEGITESISESITQGISRATGRFDSHNNGKSSGVNMGAHMLLSFGVSNSTSEGWATGTNETNSTSDTRGTSKVSGTQKSESVATGTTDNLTIEYKNKSIENLLEKIERHIKRLKSGASYGMWETATYFIAGQKKTAAIAASTYKSLLLGEESGIEKSNLIMFESDRRETMLINESLTYCMHPQFRLPEYLIDHNMNGPQTIIPVNYVNGKELPMLLNFPRKSVPGVTVSEMAEFGRNVITDRERIKRTIRMGRIYHMGVVENTLVDLDLDSLTAHCFVTGSTGSGKSNTVYKLIERISLREEKIPFLVIEPAKGEYRNEFRKIEGINLFTTNLQIDQMLKINPFSFDPKIHILEHLDRLVEIFNACWEMYAAMPAILKEAMEQAYSSKGWDLLNSVFMGKGVPQYPTFIDVLQELPRIINSSQYSSDTKGDYIGALVTRVNSMTNGIYGQVFCDDFEIDDKTLFDENTIIDLSRVGSSETKSLIMGILILKLTEHRIAGSQKGNSDLKHITVLEEAHNILKNSQNSGSPTGSSVIAKSVEMIVNSIAEMRTYGEGFIIVDQSPTSVDIAAIKNTNTKIIMRLPEEDDGKIAGHSVALNKDQIDELSKLETGVAVVMQNNWEQPVLAKIDAASHSFEGYERPESFSEIRAFHSVVLSKLLEQYEATDERNVKKVIQTIEDFDISVAKKTEMKRLVYHLTSIMDKKYDSILFGRTMLRLAGCDDVYKNAEKKLKRVKNGENSTTETFTKESLADWFKYLDNAMSQYVAINEREQDVLRQYILHSKRFENHAISYNSLYKQLYRIE